MVAMKYLLGYSAVMKDLISTLGILCDGVPHSRAIRILMCICCRKAVSTSTKYSRYYFYTTPASKSDYRTSFYHKNAG